MSRDLPLRSQRPANTRKILTGGYATGFRYRDPDRTPDGAHTLVLKSGAGSATIRFKGAGDLLSDRPGGLPAPPLAVPLRVQLQAAGGACWESAFSNPQTNESGRFDARSD
jgi:hypothetical protein